MANALTGPYDVVAEFSLGAIHRVLAAMHRGGRLQHSLSVRVDNTPRSLGTFGIVNEFGDALTSRAAVARTAGQGSQGAITSATPVARLLTQVLDPLVNAGTLEIVPPIAHPLHGVAQVQLGTPTISLPASPHNRATIHIPVMAQYFPDQGSTPLPRFLSGEFQITFAATQAFSPSLGRFIHVDLPRTGAILFQPAQTLDQDSRASINAALRHAVATAFEPSNTAVPSDFTSLEIYTLSQHNAVAVLMGLQGGQTPPAQPPNFTSFFLNPADQFGLAISSEFLSAAILNPINEALESNRHIHFSYSVDFLVKTRHYDVDIRIRNATIAFEDGSIVLTLKIRVDAEVPGPDQSDTITVKQAFTLNLNNGVVTLARKGDIDVDNSSIIFDIVDSLFGSITNRVRTAFLNAWNSRQSEIQSQVRSKLSSSKLQKFLKDMMNPVTQQTPPPEIINPTLAFTAIEIRKAGVVVHGSLAVPPWPQPHVEFDLVPNTATMQHPEYNALKSFIPGGTIQNYVWSYSGNARPADATKFVSTDAPPVESMAILGSVCVKAVGQRISPSGPTVMQPVSLQICHGLLSGNAMLSNSITIAAPDIGVTDVSDSGQLTFTGHVSPWVPRGTRTGTVNLLVHFPGDRTLNKLAELPRLLKSSGREDADTAIVGVLTSAQISKAKAPRGMAFSDDAEGWEKYLKVENRPATVLIGPEGDVLWRQDKELNSCEIVAALKKHLSVRSYFTPKLLKLPLKQGLRAPNFVFEYSPGRELTLRKLAGRRVVLLFIKESSKPSANLVAAIEKVLKRKGLDAASILAIDGSQGNAPDPGQKGKNYQTQSPLTIVPDPLHKIAGAYGISVWPTTIVLDENGIMRNIYYGQLAERDLDPPSAK